LKTANAVENGDEGYRITKKGIIHVNWR